MRKTQKTQRNKGQVEIDAKSTCCLKPKRGWWDLMYYFPMTTFEKYHHGKVLYTKKFIQPQWINLRADISRFFRLPSLEWSLRYAVGGFALWLWVRKGIGLPLFMGAVAFDAKTTGTTTTSSLTITHTTTGSNRLLLCCAGLSMQKTITGVTYPAGTNMTLHNAINFGTSDIDYPRSEIWKLAAPAAGANDMVITESAAGYLNGCAISFTGVDQTTPVGTAVTAQGNGGNAVTVDVSSNSGDIVVDSTAHWQSTSITAGAGQTERANLVAGVGHYLGVSTEAGAATVTMSWTVGDTAASEKWVQNAANISAAAAAVGNSNLLMMGVQ